MRACGGNRRCLRLISITKAPAFRCLRSPQAPSLPCSPTHLRDYSSTATREFRKPTRMEAISTLPLGSGLRGTRQEKGKRAFELPMVFFSTSPRPSLTPPVPLLRHGGTDSLSPILQEASSIPTRLILAATHFLPRILLPQLQHSTWQEHTPICLWVFTTLIDRKSTRLNSSHLG